MHHVDADKAYKEKARRDLHIYVMSYIEQILEAIFYEKPVVRPPTSYLWRSKNENISDVFLWSLSHGHMLV